MSNLQAQSHSWGAYGHGQQQVKSEAPGSHSQHPHHLKQPNAGATLNRTPVAPPQLRTTYPGQGNNSVERMSQYVQSGYIHEEPAHQSLHPQHQHPQPPLPRSVQQQQQQHVQQQQQQLQPPGGIGVVPQSYVMHQELGTGGTGSAFLVTGKVDGKRYVAKQITCLGDKYKAAPASYALHETRLLFLLQHPHIVELRDFYPKSANYFIVMEFCDNGDLGSHIQQLRYRGGGKQLDAERVLTWWYQILDGIDYCHSKGVIHRDIKPKNVFLDTHFNVKIGDFGVAALTSFPPAMERVGTVSYHAPEVVANLEYSTKSDVWAIGCIMWEVMILRLSPPGETINLQTINLALIPKSYGSAARDLLVMHLQNDSHHRPSASALKESMLHHVESANRLLASAIADKTAAEQHAAADAREALMKPRSLSFSSPSHPQGAAGGRFGFGSEAASEMGASQAATEAHGRGAAGGGGDDASSSVGGGSSTITSRASPHIAAINLSPSPRLHMGAGPPPPVVSAVMGHRTHEADDDITQGLGIRVAAGEGGELGAWKVVFLHPGMAAAASKEVSEGEYLWEVQGKVVFGMPFQVLASLCKVGTNPFLKLGLKAGLGLPIRHILLSNTQPEAEGGSAAEPREAEAKAPEVGEGADCEGDGSSSNKAAASPEPSQEGRPREAHGDGADGGGEGQDAEGHAGGVAEVSSANASAPAPEEAAPAAPPPDDYPPPPPQTPEVARGTEASASPPPSADARGGALRGAHATASGGSDHKASAEVSESSSSSKTPEPPEARGVGGGGQHQRLPSATPTPPRTLSTSRNTASPDPEGSRGGPAEEQPVQAPMVGKAANAVSDRGEAGSVSGVATIAGDGQYSGELRDGRPFGRGTATWPNQGHTYVGEWRNGVMHGQGTATYLNGDRYDGEWSLGKRSGLGRYAHGSGDVFEGLWSNERKHGLGVDTFADGRGYRGEFRDNKFAGVGTYYTVDGAVYEGDWHQGKAHGSGISTSTQGGVPAFVQYSHGNLIGSEAYDAALHSEQKQRVEHQSKAALAVALIARRIASFIQGVKIERPMADEWSVDSSALRGYFPPPDASGSSLSKALQVTAGIKALVVEDSNLVIQEIQGVDEDASVPSSAIGSSIIEIAKRSCSWYKGMSVEEVIGYLEDRTGPSLEIGLKHPHSAGYSLSSRVHLRKREPGFVV